MKVKASSFQSFRQLTQSPLIIEDSVLLNTAAYRDLEADMPSCKLETWLHLLSTILYFSIKSDTCCHEACQLCVAASSYDKTLKYLLYLLIAYYDCLTWYKLLEVNHV